MSNVKKKSSTLSALSNFKIVNRGNLLLELIGPNLKVLNNKKRTRRKL